MHRLILYGLDQLVTRSYETRCLIARRQMERGVRFVELFLGGQPKQRGGIKVGTICGTRDEVGHWAAENVVRLNDYQTAISHVMGLDHARLTYQYYGRKQRLTDGRAP